jgi:tRNA threonylcarbamoyladenosine biosynthesis protein TsaE
MNKIKITTSSPEESFELGRKIGRLCQPGDWIGLTGELGAGKTCLTKGLADGLDVDPKVCVNSPTFVIHQIYPGRLVLNHLDLYRLETVDELVDLDYDALVEGEGVCVVEWFDKIPESKPAEGLMLSIEIVDEEVRTIEIYGNGKLYNKIVKQLKV